MIVKETTRIENPATGMTSVGQVVSYHIGTHQLDVYTEKETIRLTQYEDGIFRVQLSRNETFDSFHYAIEPSLTLQPIQVTENDPDRLVLHTDQLEVILMKNPFRVIVKDVKGQILNEDDEAFGTSWIGEQVTTYKRLQPDEKFVGLGEKTGPLNKRGRGYQNWNTDHFGYGTETDPIYCSIPFYMGIHQGGAYGIFFNNSYKSHFNFGASNRRFSSFSADAGDMDYFFIHYKSVTEIIQAYSRVTGKLPLPPKWALGYQQCRYSYYPDTEVLHTAARFRDKGIPADVIVLDIHYMEQYKLFTWDHERFPSPEAMINRLKEMGFQVVVMCDPGIKREQGYPTYEDGIEADVFLKYPDGTPYEGEVWPGWCHFPDFTSADTREWWAEQLSAYTKMGIAGFWNDMNEISTWGNSLPELIEFDFDGAGASTRQARNVYGLLMAKSTLEGAQLHLKGQRPFNLTRSGFAGIQKYAAVWTGDNTASDEHMLLGIRMLNSMALSGVSFAGFDAGGFIGNASETLFARWISIAAFTPFFRGHSNVNTKSSEPWTFGEHTEEIAKNYISLRYRLMPYIYGVFYESSVHGTPVVRSLVVTDTYDEKVYEPAYENEFMLGPSLLVAPVSSQKDLEKIYLPSGQWYDLFTDKQYAGNQECAVECPLEKLPVFVRGSSIIPMQSLVQTNQEQPSEVLELHLYNGAEDYTLVYYEDDGSSYEYQFDQFYERTLTFLPNNSQLVVGAVTGDFSSIHTQIKVYFHGFEPDKTKSLAKEDYRFIDPLSNFDPIIESAHPDYVLKQVPYLLHTWCAESFTISWPFTNPLTDK